MRCTRMLVVGGAVLALLGACGDDDDDATVDDATEDTLPSGEDDAGDGGTGGEAIELSVAELTGAAEVPGPGQDGATGTVERLELTDTQVCATWTVEGLDSAAMAAHIHPGGPTESGPPLVNFGAPADAAAGAWDTCVDASADDLAAIAADPEGYYLNVHTETFPNGAVRGQLGAG